MINAKNKMKVDVGNATIVNEILFVLLSTVLLVFFLSLNESILFKFFHAQEIVDFAGDASWSF